MPSSIAYDHPSLVLGTVVDSQLLDLLDQISTLQQGIEAAQEKMNSLILMRRSFVMTLNELLDMNIDVSDLESEIKSIDAQISASATSYMATRLKNEASIQRVKETLVELPTNSQMESPVDFAKSKISSQPLAYESMKLDAQYFSFASNLQNDTLANIETYIKSANADLGKGASDVAKEATNRIQQQHENHGIAGTLVITACCMHKNVSMIEPFVLDVDKAIAVWNATTGRKDIIDTSDPAAVAALSKSPANKNETDISVISGAAYGSSFVGMVHILNTEATTPPEIQIASLNDKLKLGGWLENAVGGFGVDDDTLKEVKRMLSSQKVSSHVSLVTMGAIPTISSTKIDLAVKQIAKPDPQAINQILQNDPETDNVAKAASDSREGNQQLTIQNAKIRSLVSSLDEIDQGSNEVMDINSLMSAFDNYLKVISSGDEATGAPIRFFTKKITKSLLVEGWLKGRTSAVSKPSTNPVKPKTEES